MQLVYNVGVYGGGAAEASCIMLPSTPPPAGGWKPIIYMHGFSNLNIYTQQMFNGAAGNNTSNLIIALVNAGYAVIGADLGVFNAGNTTDANGWGNANSQTRTSNILTYARAQVSSIRQSGKAALLGVSMGSVLALNYTLNNPATVACSVHILPCCDLTSIYQQNLQGLQSSVGNALGVVFPAALPGTADPVLNQSKGPFTPVRFYYASDDPICLPSSVTKYAQQMASISTVDVGTGGHSDATVGLVNIPDVLSFLTANYP